MGAHPEEQESAERLCNFIELLPGSTVLGFEVRFRKQVPHPIQHSYIEAPINWSDYLQRRYFHQSSI